MALDHFPRLCIATSTRADWGLLRPIAGALRESKRVELQIVATNMHLLPQYGHTIDEIIADGFQISATVPMRDDGDSATERATAMAECLAGTAQAFDRLRPDALIILGDRYEMLAVASAATMMRIPIIHIAGGEITEGAIDDCIRHAITKLSTFHLTATSDYRRRVIQMGELPENVLDTGAIGVWNIMRQPLMTRAELLDNLGIQGNPNIAVVTYHPATCDDTDPTEHFDALLKALNSFPDLHYIITYPNNDARSAGIIRLIEEYHLQHPERTTIIKSLGMRRYLTAIREAVVVIGNSSSGIVEVPSAGTPTVNIGIRQQGRIAGPSVINCSEGSDAIRAAITHALSDDMQQLAAQCRNPYAKPDTLDIMTTAILQFIDSLPRQPKKFNDIAIQC